MFGLQQLLVVVIDMKPQTKTIREEKRKAANLRQVVYNNLSYTEKLSRAGIKQLKKLEKEGSNDKKDC